MGLRERKDISGPSVHQRLKSKLHHVKIKPPGTTTTWPRPCPPDLPSLSTKYNYGSDKGSLWYSLGNMHCLLSRGLLAVCSLFPVFRLLHRINTQVPKLWKIHWKIQSLN